MRAEVHKDPGIWYTQSNTEICIIDFENINKS